MQIRSLEYASPDYFSSVELRKKFLREPLGLELTEADTAPDADQHHFGIYNETGKLVGSAIGMPLPEKGPDVVRIRQVVVDEAWRAKQVGRQLMLGVEKLLSEMGFTHFELYAREEAAPFYKKCGYQPTGATEVLIGIEHEHFTKQVRKSYFNSNK